MLPLAGLIRQRYFLILLNRWFFEQMFINGRFQNHIFKRSPMREISSPSTNDDLDRSSHHKQQVNYRIKNYFNVFSLLCVFFNDVFIFAGNSCSLLVWYFFFFIVSLTLVNFKLIFGVTFYACLVG